MQSNEQPTLFDDIRHHASATPGKTAISYDQEAISYQDLLLRTSETAHALQKAGCKPGDRVLLAGLSKPELLIAVIGCFAAGCSAIPMAGGVSDSKIKFHIESASPNAVVTADEEVADMVGSVSPGLATVAPGKTGSSGNEVLPSPLTKDAIGLILYTSGTTSGIRKGVKIPHRALNSTAHFMNTFMGVDSTIVEYVASPVQHAFAFGRCHAIFRVGGTVTLTEGRFHPARMLKAIMDEKCNAISGVSSIFSMLVDHYERHLKSFGPAIKWIQLGTVGMGQGKKQTLLATFPNATICTHYGLTEAMRSTFINIRSEQNKLHTEGKSSAGVEIAIFDENGSPVACGEHGEICIKGANMACGYIGEDGFGQDREYGSWYRTRDMGSLDEEGYLSFLGRMDDILNVGGHLVSPHEIEQHLERHIAQEYCIVGITDQDQVYGDLPVLCIEGDEGPDLAWVQEQLRDVDFQLRPAKVVCFKEFPRTDNGKIRRQQLRTLLKQ